MTAKEKAQELFDKYYLICQEFTEEIQCSIQAKQCALIAVDEIQNVIYLQKTTLNIGAYKTIDDFNNDIRYNDSIRHETIFYFDFVKQEIEKL
jgi:hypothetical protein